jgi:glycerophosphoryl diester phosphodiesterase
MKSFNKYFYSITLFLFTACSGHHVLLDFPDYTDNVPEITTGYYSVHKIVNGIASTEMGTEFFGELVYLYKDDFFIDGKYYSGIKGSFLPDFYIKTNLVKNKNVYYWVQADDEDIKGNIEFSSMTQDKLVAQITTDKNQTEQVEMRYFGKQIRNDDLITMPLAHRGICYQPPNNYDGIFPANTNPGFEEALMSGYKGFEFDVRVTKDKRFIISHDEDLSAATTLHGFVKDKNLSEFENALVLKSAFIPESKATSYEAYIAAPMKPLSYAISRYIDDPRLQKMVVDIKPDTDENIYLAAKYDFEGLNEEQQKKILFLTREESTAEKLREICPYSDIALEGSIGPEPVEELEKYFPEAVGLPRGAHNTISFGANIILALKSTETSQEMINKAMELSKKYNYKILMWTFSKDWRLNFLAENEFLPDFILLDVPYYNYALHQMKYAADRHLIDPDKSVVASRYKNPIYKRMYNNYVADFWFQSRFLFSFTYGLGTPNESKITNSFATTGNWELKIGRSELNKFSKTNASVNEWYLFVAYSSSSSTLTQSKPNQVNTDFYKFGLGKIGGLGYYGPHVSLIPYTSQSLFLTELNGFGISNGSSQNNLPENDQLILNSYTNELKFGDRALYGLKFDILSSVQLNANYETDVIYPGYKFLKWTGSFVLAQVGYGILDYALGKFVDDYPVAGPIINFLAKSGFLYAYYALRKNNMNWPFTTEEPLRYSGFNFGISLVL